MTPKREKVEKYLLEKLTLLEGGNTRNADLYKKQFKSMSDKEFDQWMLDLKNKKTKLTLEVPNGFDNLLHINDILSTAKSVGCKIFDTIRMYDSTSKRYFTTPYEYCVLELPVRRLKQFLLDKMSIPESDQKLNPLSGQVVKPDKGSAIAMVEAQAISSKNLPNVLAELLTVRGGNIDAYTAMKAQLSELGTSDLKTLNIESSKVRSTEVTRAFLQGMHLDNNL